MGAGGAGGASILGKADEIDAAVAFGELLSPSVDCNGNRSCSVKPAADKPGASRSSRLNIRRTMNGGPRMDDGAEVEISDGKDFSIYDVPTSPW